MAKVRVWRYQGTAEFETHPSIDSGGPVKVYEPADKEGWEGYWWACPIDPWFGYEEDRWVLIREEDVEAAKNGECVEFFAPGLFGCEDPGMLHCYIREQCGGVDDDMYVALYEGYKLYEIMSEAAIAFEPIRLIKVYPAKEWAELEEQGYFEEEDVIV